jgi:RNA polymerase sigma factor (sigma-70 family)
MDDRDAEERLGTMVALPRSALLEGSMFALPRSALLEGSMFALPPAAMLEDSALVERILQQGDKRAFEVLVRRHKGLVRAQLRRLLGNDPATADDLAQETFTLAWLRLEQFRGDARFATWLYRIAYTCYLQFLRSQARPLPHELDGASVLTDANEVKAAPNAGLEFEPELGLGLDLAAALQRLPAQQRIALLYCVQLGLSHDEAAQVLNIPLGSIKTHVARGKAKLRELLHDWAPSHERSTSHD